MQQTTLIIHQVLRQEGIKDEILTMHKPSGMAMPAAFSSNSIIIICMMMHKPGSLLLYMQRAGVLYEQPGKLSLYMHGAGVGYTVWRDISGTDRSMEERDDVVSS